MIIYAPEPLDIFTFDELPNTINIKLPSGGFVQAIPYESNQLKIINIVSTDPSDYINSKYMPGRILTINTAIND